MGLKRITPFDPSGKPSRNRSRRSRRATLTLLFLVLAMGLPGTPSPAVGTCTTPPSIVPVSSLTPGTTATGWTAVDGQTPVSFDVEILGILPDGIAPGVDFVLIQVSGANVDGFGGIASGMSGSPVYIGTDLVGAVSYGFEGGDHSLGGLTPAEDMVELFNYPDASAMTLSPEVELTPTLRAVAGEARGAPELSSPATAEQLPIPLAVSGLSKHGMERLDKRLARLGLPFVPFKSGSAAAPSPLATPGTQPAPGEPVAAMLSFGDVTWGGIGTQTATCGDLSVAFGHPLGWFGRTSMGMNEASVLKVVSDPSGIWGPFKLATVGANAGVIDQDRMAGIRGVADVSPEFAPITSLLDNAELGTSTAGETDAVTPLLLPDIASFHLAQAVWDANDSYWEGTAKLHWQIDGLREDGSPFTLVNDDAYYNGYDVGWEASMYLWYQLAVMQENDFEQISITSVDIVGDVTQDRLTSRLREVRSKTGLQPTSADRSVILVRRGRKIFLEVDLDPWGPASTRTETYSFTVPKHAQGRLTIGVFGGAEQAPVDYYYGGYGGYSEEPQDFDDLLASLESWRAGDDLVVGLYGFPPGYTDSAITETVRTQPDIVRGSRWIRVKVVP